MAALASGASAQTIKLGGNGALVATMRALGAELQRIEPAFAFTIVPNLGTSGAIKAIQAGAIDIALSTRPASPADSASGIVSHDFARTPVIFAARSAGGTRLTPDLIADIYAAKVTNWPDGKPIRIVLRPSSQGDTTALFAISPKVKAAVEAALKREGMVKALTDQEAADKIGTLPGGFGTTTLALVMSERRSLEILPVDGVMPSLATMADGSYPYVKHFYLITKDANTPAAKRFIAFARSPEAARTLGDNGLLPAAGGRTAKKP